MEKLQNITVNTGLKSFVLIDRIAHAEARNIRGIKTFVNAPACLGLESLVQLGAFHVRYLTDFERHAFLLKITRCLMPAQGELNGTYALSGRLVSRCRSAFSYILEAKKDDKVRIDGEFMFATVDYDRIFKKEILLDHYRNVFLCLKSDSKAD